MWMVGSGEGIDLRNVLRQRDHEYEGCWCMGKTTVVMMVSGGRGVGRHQIMSR